MKSASCLPVLSLAVSVTLFSGAFSQERTSQIEAGIDSGGLHPGQVRPMTVEIAKKIVAAAKKGACASPTSNCSGAFAITDDAGVLVYLEAIDGVDAGGPELAIRKARTAAIWRRSTKVFKDAVDSKSNSSYADGTFPDMTTSPGGIPIFKDGRVVGGFGPAAVGNDSTQIEAAVLAEVMNVFGKQ